MQTCGFQYPSYRLSDYSGTWVGKQTRRKAAAGCCSKLFTTMSDEKTRSKPGGKIAVKNPPVLLERTQKVIGQIEAAVNQRLLTDWNSPNGSICDNDVTGLYGILRSIGKIDRLTLFVKSSGGSGQASLRMVNLLRQFTKYLTVLVPLGCESAATMLALGADRILMGPLAHLSAVDTSLIHDLSPIDRDNDRVSVSQDELQRVVRLWQEQSNKEASNPDESLFHYVHPLVVGAVDRSSALSTKVCLEILSYHLKDSKTAKRISNTLNSTYPSHSYPITRRFKVKESKLGNVEQEFDTGVHRQRRWWAAVDDPRHKYRVGSACYSISVRLARRRSRARRLPRDGPAPTPAPLRKTGRSRERRPPERSVPCSCRHPR
jgi:Serine dehydrogenase proteinase